MDVDKKPIILTAKEFDLLYVLMKNAGRILTREFLLERIWGYAVDVSTRTVDVHIRRLRKKLMQNFNSSGRELIRVTLPAATFVSGFYTITAPTNFIELNVPTGAATYNNTDQLSVKGVADNTSPQCGPGTTTTGATFESSDALDLDGDGATNENYCQWAASLTVPPSGGPAFTLVKTVQGDQDPAPKFSRGDRERGPGRHRRLQPHVVKHRRPSAEQPGDLRHPAPHRGHRRQPEPVHRPARQSVRPGVLGPVGGAAQRRDRGLLDVVEPLPAGGVREPRQPDLRGRLEPDASADLSTVTAVRFTASGTYQPAQQFTVGVLVTVPPQFVNIVAWNSAASDATTTAGVPLLPAEPPKVGLRRRLRR